MPMDKSEAGNEPWLTKIIYFLWNLCSGRTANIIYYLLFIFLYLCLPEGMLVHHMHAAAQSDAAVMELQVVVNVPVWVLGTYSSSLAGQLLDPEPSLHTVIQFLHHCFTFWIIYLLVYIYKMVVKQHTISCLPIS